MLKTAAQQQGAVTLQEGTQAATQALAQQSTSQKVSTPARKGFILYVRTFPKGTEIWIQGTVIATAENEITIDDGSAVARIQYKVKRDNSLDETAYRTGAYIMAVGKMSMRLKENRMGMLAHTIRYLSPNGPFLKKLWELEVVDSFLFHQNH